MLTNPTAAPFATEYGTVIDPSTGLEWQQASSTERMTWTAADQYVRALTLGGHRDWRQPTRRELLTLVDDTRCDPAIDVTLFPDTQPRWHWSSSAVAGNPDYAWLVDFYYGGAGWDSRNCDCFVRAVRSVASVSPGQ